MSTKFIDYRVIGRGDFPTDMLRYDASWPVDSESASKLARSIYDNSDDAQRKWMHDNRVIHLRAAHAFGRPTEGRWSSFGWSVVNENLFGHKNDAQVEAYFNEGKDK